MSFVFPPVHLSIPHFVPHSAYLTITLSNRSQPIFDITLFAAAGGHPLDAHATSIDISANLVLHLERTYLFTKTRVLGIRDYVNVCPNHLKRVNVFFFITVASPGTSIIIRYSN